MSAHTPGRWEFYGGYLVRAVNGENATPIADLRAPYRRGVGAVRGEREQQANGHLLAAADDLLAVCERFAAENDGPETWAMLRAAIRKARGQ